MVYENGATRWPHLADGAAFAGLVTAFAMLGVAVSLDYPGRGAFRVLFSFEGPFLGAVVGWLVIKQARYFYVILVAIVAVVGLRLGIATQPDAPSVPQGMNTMWIATCTFAPAWAATLWRRSQPDSSNRPSVHLIVVMVLLFISILIGSMPYF